MWNANNSKFYAQIMDGLANLFGMKAEDTTEAELHQRLTEAETHAAMAEKAKAEGLAAAAAEVADLKAQLTALAAEKAEAVESATELTANVAELTEKVAGLESDLTAANTALAAKVKEANTLAGEVARLTAGKKPKEAADTDGDEHLSKAPAGNGQVVKLNWSADKPFVAAN